MKLRFEEKGRKLTPSALAKFERSIGAQLPDDYRQFLLKVNGGVLEEDMSFPIPGEGASSDTVLGEFYTLADDSEDFQTLGEALESFVQERRMPSWFLPVADDAFGNQVCISLAKVDFGAVYFWNHEQEPETNDEDSESFPNVYAVANSFNAFLEQLKPLEEED